MVKKHEPEFQVNTLMQIWDISINVFFEHYSLIHKYDPSRRKQNIMLIMIIFQKPAVVYMTSDTFPTISSGTRLSTTDGLCLVLACVMDVYAACNYRFF